MAIQSPIRLNVIRLASVFTVFRSILPMKGVSGFTMLDFSHNKQLETQRDIFVFQCLTSYRLSDWYKMTYRNIIDGSIEYIPRKTKEDRAITVRVPLSKTAQKIIERYRDYERELLFPLIIEQKYNQYIK
ncbi:hypothetical protein EZS27_031204 [termite gut metagenome]|uniref:Uncharacterized protein n=1 Tax=termite gut metagenome TaxID=433724 RepID=A0A5J4QE08_9ZZZZ